MQHSSSTTGFFQEVPVLSQVFSAGTAGHSEDATLKRVLRLYLPTGEYEDGVSTLARQALDPKVLVHSVDAETHHPSLQPSGTFGKENRFDPLWTTEGWRQLKRLTHEGGIIAAGYEDSKATLNRRINQFALCHVWSSTSTMISCPMAMTDGAAKLLRAHLDDPDHDQPGRNRVMREAYKRLTSRDASIAWTAGQWMTERSGGSDVSGTETVATRVESSQMDAHGLPLGPWSINGFKWFSSATDSEVALMLARTPKGLGLFMAPLRRAAGDSTELNGIRIQRLKDKLGTKALPTAELELHGVRAWLIGEEGEGVKEISMVLNLTRLHTAASCVSGWSRSLHVSRAYSSVRKVRGGLLQDNPLHLRWMADNTVQYSAACHFSFFCIALLGAQEQLLAQALFPEDPNALSALFRLLTPVLKSQVSVASVLGIRECMECLGGIGYCENNQDGGLFNIARIFRDNLVSPIWEGTVSVMAEDVVRVMTDKRIGSGTVIASVFLPWAEGVLSRSSSAEVAVVRARLDVVKQLESCDKAELLYRGRELLTHIEFIVCAVLLLYDANTDDNPIATAIAQRYVLRDQGSASTTAWNAELEMDRAIFLGTSGPKLARL